MDAILLTIVKVELTVNIRVYVCLTGMVLHVTAQLLLMKATLVISVSTKYKMTYNDKTLFLTMGLKPLGFHLKEMLN